MNSFVFWQTVKLGTATYSYLTVATLNLIVYQSVEMKTNKIIHLLKIICQQAHIWVFNGY